MKTKQIRKRCHTLAAATMTLVVSATSAVHAAPIMNVFELEVQDGQSNAYEQVGKTNIHQSLTNEEGTLAMYSVQSQDNPNIRYMIEIYADAAAYQAHLQSPQYQAFKARAPQLLTDHKVRTELTPQYLGDKPTPIQQTDAIITNMVRINVHPEDAAAFKEVVMPEMVQSLAVEEGVLAIYAGTTVDNPNTWLFFEIYASEEAYQAHRETPHFKEYLRLTPDMLGEKTFYDIRPTLLKNQGGLDYRGER